MSVGFHYSEIGEEEKLKKKIIDERPECSQGYLAQRRILPDKSLVRGTILYENACEVWKVKRLSCKEKKNLDLP